MALEAAVEAAEGTLLPAALAMGGTGECMAVAGEAVLGQKSAKRVVTAAMAVGALLLLPIPRAYAQTYFLELKFNKEGALFILLSSLLF